MYRGCFNLLFYHFSVGGLPQEEDTVCTQKAKPSGKLFLISTFFNIRHYKVLIFFDEKSFCFQWQCSHCCLSIQRFKIMNFPLCIRHQEDLFKMSSVLTLTFFITWRNSVIAQCTPSGYMMFFQIVPSIRQIVSQHTDIFLVI